MRVLSVLYLMLGFFLSIALTLMLSGVSFSAEHQKAVPATQSYLVYYNAVTNTKIAYQIMQIQGCGGFVPIDSDVVQCRDGKTLNTVPVYVRLERRTESEVASPDVIDLKSPVKIMNPYETVVRWGNGYVVVGGLGAKNAY